VELPVVCGRSSFKPEVAASGFSFFIELKKSLIFYELTRYFLIIPLSKNTLHEYAAGRTGFNANQIL